MQTLQPLWRPLPFLVCNSDAEEFSSCLSLEQRKGVTIKTKTRPKLFCASLEGRYTGFLLIPEKCVCVFAFNAHWVTIKTRRERECVWVCMCVYKEHCLTITIRKERESVCECVCVCIRNTALLLLSEKRESVCVRHSGWLLIPGDKACVSLTRQQSKVRNTEAGKLAQRGEGRHTGIRHHCPGTEELSVDSSRPRKRLATQPRAARNRRPLNWPPPQQAEVSNGG